MPPPSATSTLKGAPKIAGLSESCARVVWYTVMEYSPETTQPGVFEAVLKFYVPKKDGDAFFLPMGNLIRNQTSEENGWYKGKWTYTQLCEIEKSKLVSFHVHRWEKSIIIQ
jgi:hypothetical protein